jgi:hypothetical protein
MTNELEKIYKDVVVFNFWGTFSAFSGRDRAKPEKTLIGAAGFHSDV